MYYRDYPMMGEYHSGWGFVMMTVGLLLFIIATVVVVQLLRRDTAHHHPKNDDSLGIAKERYAKGEITKQEFEQLKKDLQ